MKLVVYIIITGCILISLLHSCVQSNKADTQWVQPSNREGKAVWGFKDGIRISLNPESIRGLILIHTPYLGHEENDVINFFAIEPIVKGELHRGFSEMEQSSLDGVQGKRIWSSDSDSDCGIKDVTAIADGIVRKENGMETLAVYLFIEPFENGAKVYVRARFFSNNPYEVEISTYKCQDSENLDYCIVTATMGNYSRLRNLYLKDKVISSLDLWPDFSASDFTPHEYVKAEKMIHDNNGYPYFIAAADEENPEMAVFAENTPDWWRYYGKKATQYWYSKAPKNDTNGIVNGRVVYWGDLLPIPGGISYENFELKQEFGQGDSFVFGVSPLSPEKFIDNLK